MMTPAFASAAEAAIGTWLSPPAGQRIMTRTVEVSVGYNTHSKLKITRLECGSTASSTRARTLPILNREGCARFRGIPRKPGAARMISSSSSTRYNDLVSNVTGTGTVGGGAFYDTRPPVVTFANVKSGDVLRGTALIKLNTVDDNGQAPLVSLLVDHALKLIKNRPPYEYDLDTTTYADGSHELQTYAFDGAGNKSDPAVVKVTFSNNLKRPLVSTLDVKPAEPAGEEGQDTVGSLPPVAVISALASSRTQRGAGRVVESTAQSSGVEAAPIASREARAKRIVAPVAASPMKVSVKTQPAQVRLARAVTGSSLRPSCPALPEVAAAVRRPAPSPSVADAKIVSTSRGPKLRTPRMALASAGKLSAPDSVAKAARKIQVSMAPEPLATGYTRTIFRVSSRLRRAKIRTLNSKSAPSRLPAR